MNVDLTFSIKVFAALFAIMNPIANVPVFLSLTEGATDGARRKVALTAALGVTIILPKLIGRRREGTLG